MTGVLGDQKSTFLGKEHVSKRARFVIEAAARAQPPQRALRSEARKSARRKRAINDKHQMSQVSSGGLGGGNRAQKDTSMASFVPKHPPCPPSKPFLMLKIRTEPHHNYRRAPSLDADILCKLVGPGLYEFHHIEGDWAFVSELEYQRLRATGQSFVEHDAGAEGWCKIKDSNDGPYFRTFCPDMDDSGAAVAAHRSLLAQCASFSWDMSCIVPALKNLIVSESPSVQIYAMCTACSWCISAVLTSFSKQELEMMCARLAATFESAAADISWAMSNLFDIERSRTTMLQAGACPLLVAALISAARVGSRSMIVLAISTLVEHEDGRAALLETGACPSLVAALTSAEVDEIAIILGNLAQNEGGRVAAIQAGSCPALVAALVSAKNDGSVACISFALSKLTKHLEGRVAECPDTSRLVAVSPALGLPPPIINFATEWLDDSGRVCPKNVDFSQQCPKGHALMLMDNVDYNGSIKELMCRICHTLCAREADETASWFICSVDPVCCSGYAVCASCLLAPNALSVTSTVSEFDDARKLVSSSKFSADAARTSASCAIIFAPPKHSRCRESRCRIFLGCGQSWRRRLVA